MAVCDGTSDGQQAKFLYAPPDIGDEVEVEENDKSEKGRKRKRDPDKWKNKHVKSLGLRKNSPVVTITDEMECCRKKCLRLFSVSHMQRLRRSFESMMYEEQNIYLNGLLHRRETKKASGHPRKANSIVTAQGKKVGRPPAEDSIFSFIWNEEGIDVRICQKAFCDVHGFGPKRLQILRRKLGQGPELEPDKRGKHNNHQSVDEEIKKLVREHIETYPTRRSHYSRNDNIERVYLPSELSIANWKSFPNLTSSLYKKLSNFGQEVLDVMWSLYIHGCS